MSSPAVAGRPVVQPDAPPAAEFGTLLRRHREAAGLSQEDLAERAALTASAIGALERGERRRPYPHTLQLLAKALRLDETHREALFGAVPRRGGVARRDGHPPGVQATTATSPATAAATAPVAAPVVSPGAGLPPPPAPVPGFVGRRAELQVLEARLAEAMGGRGGVTMLVGEAGIGKTRLASEFASLAARQGAEVLRGACFEGDWQPAYGPWIEAIGSYARSHTAAALAGTLGAGAAAIAQLVPDVRAALPDVPPLTQLSADEARFRLHDAVIRLLLAAAVERPLVLVLDDVHWADPDSLRLLRHVARFLSQARLLVVGAYRDPEFGVDGDHPLMDTLAVLRREGDYVRVPIQGFTQEEISEYLAHAAGERLPQALVRAIEEETGGNPFYAREVFRHLTEEAKVLRRDGRWSTDRSIRELGIPEGVRQVVGRRVARLSAPAATLLRQAAGFTAGFEFDVLQVLSELPEPALLDCLDEALQAGLIRSAHAADPASQASTAHQTPRYEFAHAIVRHTLYEALNLDRRARLHRRIALALEQVRGGGPEDTAELAAQYHASAALPGAGAGIPYALTAARRAHEAYSYERSAAYLRMARDLAASRPAAERAEILCGLARCEAEAVQLDRAPVTLNQALEALDAAGAEPRAQVELLAAVARSLKEGGANARVWEPLVERGLALVGEQRDLPWARLALLQDHFELIQSGTVGCAHWLGTDPQAIVVARAEGAEEDYARTLEPLDCRTREETGAILGMARTWSRPVAVMRALEVAGRDLVYRHGDFQASERVYEALLDAGERYGSIPAQAEALSHLTSTRMAMGKLRLARETLRRAQDVITRLGPEHRLQFASTNIEIFLDYLLDEDRPGDWARLAEAIAARATGPVAARSPAGIIAAANSMLSATRAGLPDQARALLPDVTAVAERTPSTAYCHTNWMTSAASVVWHLEAAEYAATYLRLVERLIRAHAADALNGPLELCAARMTSLLGNLDQARAYFTRAREKSNAAGMAHWRAIVDHDEAGVLMRAGGAGSDGRAGVAQLLDQAEETFRAQGMLGWASRAAAQRAALVGASGPVMRSAAAGTMGSPLRAGVDRLPAGLTGREAEVLRLVASGMTNKEIAAHLVLSLPTVERHVANIYSKIGVDRRYDAIAFAHHHGLQPLRSGNT